MRLLVASLLVGSSLLSLIGPASSKTNTDWTEDGITLSVAPLNEYTHTMVADGAGGAYVFWAQNGWPVGMRISPDGSIASGWKAGGTAVPSTGYPTPLSMNVVTDGARG